MRRSLTSKDIKDLKSHCKMGYIISLLLFIFGTIIGVTIYESYFDCNPNTINNEMIGVISLAVLLLSIMVCLGINLKYFTDIRNNEKIQEIKVLQDKNYTKDYYRTTAINRYDFIVDSIKIRVDKELFESCSKGDKLIFNYAPKSKYLLSIEKKQINS